MGDCENSLAEKLPEGDYRHLKMGLCRIAILGLRKPGPGRLERLGSSLSRLRRGLAVGQSL